MSSRHRGRLALGLTLLFAVLAAACGGGDGEPATKTSSAEETVPTSSDAKAIVSAQVYPTSPTPPPLLASTGRIGDEQLAPELKGISGWINSEPFTLESHRGKVVLVDFWTYTCVNCIRTLPYLRAWHEKYAEKGLVIVGVHTPEFDFEKLRENVVDAVGKFGLEYAVAQDNDYDTWNAFRNRYWPAKYLIDRDGYIRYSHFGEGFYDETEAKIRELLGETGADLGSVSINTLPEPERDVDAISAASGMGQTRELFAGYRFNYSLLQSASVPPYVLHQEYYEVPDSDILYIDPDDHTNHFMYLNGLWRNQEERIVHARETEEYEDYIALKFYATSVNAVMSPLDAQPSTVRVTIDGGALATDQTGTDILFDEDGNSYVLVDEARMYNLVNIPVFSGHELKLRTNSTEFSLFAFSFGSYEGGEPEP